MRQLVSSIKKFGLSFVKEEDDGENYCYLSQSAVWEY